MQKFVLSNFLPRKDDNVQRAEILLGAIINETRNMEDQTGEVKYSSTKIPVQNEIMVNDRHEESTSGVSTDCESVSRTLSRVTVVKIGIFGENKVVCGR